MTTRQADPWKDLAVIDARAPRVNQAVVAIGSVVALATGAWPIFAVLGAQLTVAVVFGRQYCLPCQFYFRVLQPRLGEGPLEDSRAPRFANIIGAVFLNAAALTSAVGFTTVGLVLGGIVAALASLAVLTGLCVGCEVYKLLAHLRGVKGRLFERVDLEQLGAVGIGNFVVEFTHPLCADCQTLERKFQSEGRRVVKVDVSKRRDLARKYGVSLVPLAFEVSADGTVLARLS
jgi:hypothetical protein